MTPNLTKYHAFRDCFEAGMEYEEALGCVGLADTADTKHSWEEFAWEEDRDDRPHEPMEADMQPADWSRRPDYDRRFANGDDYAGDAWQHIKTREIRWTAVGVQMADATAEEIFVFDE